MASRKDQKEAARAQRLAQERASSDRARRERRMRMGGGVVLAVIAIVAVAIAVSSGGGGGTAIGLQKGGAARSLSAAVQNQFAGIPQSGVRLGNPKAPVTMTYYGDLECPICQDFTLRGGFPQLVAHEVKSGQVQILYRSFQTATTSPVTFKTQQVAALAAGQQNKFWDFTELFYRQQGQEASGYVSENYLTGLAQEVTGLDLAKWQTARSNAALGNQVASDGALGTRLGVSGTPTLVFQGPKGSATPSSSVPSYSDIQATIKKVS